MNPPIGIELHALQKIKPTKAMKEAIIFIEDAAESWMYDSIVSRTNGDHVLAAQQEKTAESLRSIAKLAKLI